MKWKDFTLRLRALVYHRQLEQDLQDELSSHIELQTRKNLLQGMEATEARRQALMHFSGVQRVTEECRDARGVNWITTPLKDALYALRGFRRSPIFVITDSIASGGGVPPTPAKATDLTWTTVRSRVPSDPPLVGGRRARRFSALKGLFSSASK